MQKDDRGVVVLFAYSLGYAERVTVMLHTLRQHWAGSVLLMVDQTTEELGRKIAEDPHVQIDVQVIKPVEGVRHAPYITKTLVPTWTPYKRTVLIDGDTSVNGSLDELFEPSLVITQFSNWHSKGRLLSNRIGWWRGKSEEIDRMIEKQLSCSWPAINTGVVGFHQGHLALENWHRLTLAGAGLHMTDEIAMQLLTSVLPTDCYSVFDDRWNCSPIYGINRQDVRIWHYHGRKHLRREQGQQLWMPLLREAIRADVGGIAKWAGQYDPLVGMELTK